MSDIRSRKRECTPIKKLDGQTYNMTSRKISSAHVSKHVFSIFYIRYIILVKCKM